MLQTKQKGLLELAQGDLATWCLSKGFDAAAKFLRQQILGPENSVPEQLAQLEKRLTRRIDLADLKHLRAGLSHLMLDEPEKAKDHFIQAEASQSSLLKYSPVVRYLLASTLRMCGNRQEAQALFMAALRLNPFILSPELINSWAESTTSAVRELPHHSQAVKWNSSFRVNKKSLAGLGPESGYLDRGFYWLLAKVPVKDFLHTQISEATISGDQVVATLYVSVFPKRVTKNNRMVISLATDKAKKVLVRTTYETKPRLKWVKDLTGRKLYFATPELVIVTEPWWKYFRILSADNGEELVEVDKELFNLLFQPPIPTSGESIFSKARSQLERVAVVKNQQLATGKELVRKSVMISDPLKFNPCSFTVSNIWKTDENGNVQLRAGFARTI